MGYKNKIVMGLLVVFCAIALLWVLKYSVPSLSLFTSRTARLEIEYEGEKRAFEGEVIDDMTILDALQASSLAGNITFEYFFDGDHDKKLVISRLNGYQPQSDKPLFIYLNSSEIDPTRIHVTEVEPGDIITVKTPSK